MLERQLAGVRVNGEEFGVGRERIDRVSNVAGRAKIAVFGANCQNARERGRIRAYARKVCRRVFDWKFKCWRVIVDLKKGK